MHWKHTGCHPGSICKWCSTPDGVRTFGTKLLIMDVVEFIAEIRILGGSSPWFNPLSFYSHFTHIFTNRTLCIGFAGYTKFSGYFRSNVILFGIIIYFLDFFFGGICLPPWKRDFPVKESPVRVVKWILRPSIYAGHKQICLSVGNIYNITH